MESLKFLLDEGKVQLAKLPENNDLPNIETLAGYTVPLIAHDYAAKTPSMWNAVYKQLGLNIRNIMVTADPADAKEILSILKEDPKYLGGGAGVGFKEKVIPFLDKVEPNDLASVNIIVKEKGELVGYNTDALGLYQSVEDGLNQVNKKIEGSNVIIFGAGGVAKQFARVVAQHKAANIAILNRTITKAVKLAHELNLEYVGTTCTGAGEHMIRGHALNSFPEGKPDVLVNTTDKGSDGKLENYSALAAADVHNENLSRTVARELRNLNPNVIVQDIVLPKSGAPTTLRHARNEGLTRLIGGLPMVINQGAPAYVYVQNAHPEIHKQQIEEKQVLGIMREAVNYQSLWWE